ncbi:MAG: biotin--[acetyl-CoA-carboxylase] ligase [Burkholderiales bacterium]|nr:biotin--[acetyl-CoA-carboxylase] ligase [Burkholderiales bacterium]
MSSAGSPQAAKDPLLGPIHWPAEAIWAAVSPSLPGFSVEILPEIDSTNTELMRRARAGQADAVLLVAERQTAGRGRLGRQWFSGNDGHTEGQFGAVPTSDGAACVELQPSLTFSLGFALAPQDWSGLSLAVGLALAESLHPSLQLKWPNDLWLQGRKLGGILIETASLGELRYAVVGIGLNITPRSGQGLRTPPAALSEVLPGVNAPTALARLVPPLVSAVQRFESDGFGPLRAAFHARDVLYGKEILCNDGTTGFARGVDTAGALLVHTKNGLKKITSAEVSVRPTPSTQAQ